jgi:hypothetical protein
MSASMKASEVTNRGLLVGIPLLVSLLFSGAYMAYLAPHQAVSNANSEAAPVSQSQPAASLSVTQPRASQLSVQAQDASSSQSTVTATTLQNSSSASMSSTTKLKVTHDVLHTNLLKTLTDLTDVH